MFECFAVNCCFSLVTSKKKFRYDMSGCFFLHWELHQQQEERGGVGGLSAGWLPCFILLSLKSAACKCWRWFCAAETTRHVSQPSALPFFLTRQVRTGVRYRPTPLCSYVTVPFASLLCALWSLSWSIQCVCCVQRCDANARLWKYICFFFVPLSLILLESVWSYFFGRVMWSFLFPQLPSPV